MKPSIVVFRTGSFKPRISRKADLVSMDLLSMVLLKTSQDFRQ